MDSITIYAISLCGVFVAVFLVANLLPISIRLLKWFCRVVSRSLLVIFHYTHYRHVINRHSAVGPWVLSAVLANIAYIVGNIICLNPQAENVVTRAGLLSLINMAPLFLGSHLSFLADLFGLPLRTFRHIHRSCGLMSAALVLVHAVLVATKQGSFSMNNLPNKLAVTGAVVIVGLVILSAPPLRRRWYEFFLRTHQALAIVFAVCTVVHLRSIPKYPWLPIYIFGTVCGALSLVQLGLFTYRNVRPGSLRPYIKTLREIQDSGVIEVTLSFPRPLLIDAGHYVNIWVPSVGFWSTHPFTVVSWSPVAQTTIGLLIEPRSGFTNKLLRCAKLESGQHLARRVLLSGPHGRCLPVWEFKTVIMFATGFGIATMIPHVKKLIYGNILGKGFIRRIRLVWQVENSNLRKGIDTFINDLLFADASEDSYVLSISIYDPTWKIEESLGEHQRVTILPGPLDIDEVIGSEATAKFITDSKLKKNFTQAGGRTLVLMSGSGAMRDSVRRVTRNYLTKGFELRELDYQPET
ncbi:hypothetical protein BKA56DRAFT_496850 [Ilyonectria sp. MPI-CAGE-AT-0026]|nr:hypothetical protein BKA56DRAFT_496850 [Ilyonectria sp. MPI-CAGE-AT-0026]